MSEPKFQRMRHAVVRGPGAEPVISYRRTNGRNLLHLNRPARDLIPDGPDGRKRIVIEYAEGGFLRISPAEVGDPDARLINRNTGQASVIDLTHLKGWRSGLTWRLDEQLRCVPLWGLS